MSTDLSKLAEKLAHDIEKLRQAMKNPYEHFDLFVEIDKDRLALRAALAADIKICPECRATDNNPYVDAKGIRMRACGRCLIQWREEPLAAEEERVGKLVESSRTLAEACMLADSREELSEIIDGSMIDDVRAALRDFQPSPAGEQK